ncbi:amine oxidase [Chitinispirillum alkaliphilum]|nr:amine oxidase [Chitinispirillum alkaliphilum]
MVIIGGGLAGLGAAWEFSKRKMGGAPIKYTMLEKEGRVGGLCRTEQQGDFLFDYTGHLLHFQTDLFRDLVFSFDQKFEQKNRKAWIFTNGVYTKYPFQANLYGLPKDIVIECIYEYSKRYFSGIKEEIVTFEDWIRAHFGDGIARHFMIPYNSKIFKKHPAELTPDTTGRFVPSSNLKLLLAGALAENEGDLGYNSVFHYPQRGGIESVIKNISSRIDNIELNESVVAVKPQEQLVITSSGKKIPYDYLVSTQPLPSLVENMEGVSDTIREASGKLNHVSVLNINFGISGNISEKHWVYTPENDFPFHRIGFPHNFSPFMAPKRHSSVYLEISYDPAQGINIEEAKRSSVAALVRMGVIEKPEQIVAEKIIDIPHGYVIFDKERNRSVETIKDFLTKRNIYSVGRFGAWEYSSMEDAFTMGVEAAEDIHRKIIRYSEAENRVSF